MENGTHRDGLSFGASFMSSIETNVLLTTLEIELTTVTRADFYQNKSKSNSLLFMWQIPAKISELLRQELSEICR